MNRYNKLQRRIRASQEDFLGDLVTDAGFKVCTDVSRPPEGKSVYIEWAAVSRDGAHYNFVLIPCFAVPNYMSVNKSSPTYKERSAQEKHSIKNAMFDKLMAEGLSSIDVEDTHTNDVKIRVTV
jgi:hypothetical protein